MLLSVVKYGVLIFISMSFCVYADQSCTDSAVCNNICYRSWKRMKRCRNKCDACMDLALDTNSTFNSVCDVSGAAGNAKCKGRDLRLYCHQCATTENVTYPEPSNVTEFIGSTDSSFTTDEKNDEDNTPTMVDKDQGNTGEGEDIDDKNMTTTPTTVEGEHENKDQGSGENEAEKVSDNGDNSTAVKAAIGSVVSVFVLIGLAIIIWYFMKKKSRKMTTPQSVSYNVDNITYGTTEEIHSKDISENNRVDIEVHDDSQYNTLYDTTEKKETNEYAYASYPGDSQDQSKPTVYLEVSKASPEYYTLQKEQESDVTESSSDVKVTPKDTDTLKQNGSQSEYMCLQHDGSTTTNTPPPATQNEDDAEYAYASYPEDCRDQSKPTGCAKVSNDLPEYYTPKKDKDSDVTRLNITSLQNDDAYDELRLDVNDSNDNSYDTLNHLARNVPDAVTDDYNKLIPTPVFDEESEEYSHLNRTLKTDERVTDQGYRKLELPTEPTAGTIKPATKANDGYEETLPNLPNDDTRDVNSPIISNDNYEMVLQTY